MPSVPCHVHLKICSFEKRSNQELFFKGTSQLFDDIFDNFQEITIRRGACLRSLGSDQHIGTSRGCKCVTKVRRS